MNGTKRNKLISDCTPFEKRQKSSLRLTIAYTMSKLQPGITALLPCCLRGHPVLHLPAHEPLLWREVVQVSPLPGRLVLVLAPLLLLLHLMGVLQGVHATQAVCG